MNPEPLASPAPPLSPPPGRPGRKARVVAAGLLAAGLIGTGGAAGSLWTAIALRVASNPAALAGSPGASAESAAAIYQQAIAGVVTVSTELGGTPRRFTEATGSGFVLDSQGRILTNAHVVSNARQLRVTFHDGETVGAQVVGVDASDDLAVIQVSVSAGKLHPLPLGDSDAVRVGDMALAIGSPFGLQGTLTAGIVSGVDRTKTAPTGRALRGMIQTDAAINPGNSGGPLLNRAGEVIGIDESIESPVEGSVGVGFAIPINTAKRVLPELQRGQAIQYPWLGIRGQAITPSQVDALGLQEKTGVLVIEVIANGPAARAGLHADGQPSANNDIVMAVDGRSVASLEALTAYLDGKHVGDKVTLQVSRQGKRLSLEATLAAFPAP